jgi:hypothetical protein
MLAVLMLVGCVLGDGAVVPGPVAVPGHATLSLLREKGLISDEEYQLAVAAEEAQQPRPPVTVSATLGKGITVTALDDTFSLNVWGRFAVRDALSWSTRRTFGSGPSVVRTNVTDTMRGSTNEATIKTLRLYLGGHVLTRDLRYQVQLAFGPGDFETGNPSPVFDAWVEYTRFRDFNVRAGQFFVPFDRLRTIREATLQFPDRPQPIGELTLDRDVGVELLSKDFLGLNGALSYNLFVGGGDGKNNVSAPTPGLLYAGRVSLRPLGAFDDNSEGDLERLWTPRLALGAGLAFNHNATRQRGTTGSRYALGTFNYIHGALDMVVKFAGFSLIAEVVARKATVFMHDGHVNNVATREYSRSGAGYIIQAGMMLTDKLEVVGRFSRILAIRPTDPALEKVANDQGNEFGTGLNCYLAGHRLKAQADYQYQFGTSFSDVGRHVARVHLDVSF